MGFLDWLFGTSTADTQANGTVSPQQVGPHEGGGTATAVAPAGEGTPDGSTRDGDADETESWWDSPEATLTEQVEPLRPDLPPDARALENLLISHFDGHNLTLPPLLAAAERVLPLLSRKDYSVKEIANAIAEDQVIAAALLRMANSPMYRGVSQITAMAPAIGRLGARALRMLLLHESMRAASFTNRSGLKELAQSIWRRSMASACTMRGLAELTGTDKENAFLAGLLHDIGYVVVLRITHEYCQGARYAVDLDFQTFEYLGFESHQEFGELVADAWSLADEMKAILSSHHRYPNLEDPHRTIRLQLHLTDMIVSLLGYSEYRPYDLLHSRPVQDLGLTHNARFIVFLERLPVQIDEMVGAV